MKKLHHYRNAAEVRELLGKICDMTLRRWIESRGFPAPYICGRLRLWSEEEIQIWVEAQRPAALTDVPENRPEMKPGSEFAKKTGDAVDQTE